MNKDIILVIMAAGMGSRFGGLKQIEGVGPNNEFIIDYSVYDAIKAGFTKIVFIIKKEMYEIFCDTIGKRVENLIPVEYVFQEMSNLPENCPTVNREKPLGTAQAIYCCRDIVKSPFAIINADDFYGSDAYVQAVSYLKNVDIQSNNYAMIAYHIINTLTENGAVKRGVCNVENGYLTDLIESSVIKEKEEIIASPLNGDTPFNVAKEQSVSMNMLLFTPTIFTFIQDNFNDFFKENKEDMERAEYLIPDLLQKLLKKGLVTTKVLETTSSWYGITYREDLNMVKDAINEMIEKGIYPHNLWKK